MNDPFPFLIGRIALTEKWSIDLPRACKQRFEDSSMVLWHPGFTIWISVWGNNSVWRNNKGQSAQHRLSESAAEASSGKFDETALERNGIHYFSYRIDEDSEGDRAPAFQGFAFAEWGHLQLSIYFDDESDAALATKVLYSANGQPPYLADATILSQACFATNKVMQDGSEVGFMYREPPDSEADSGWRFFSGQETQDYVHDPSNTQVYPVAFVVEKDRAILSYLESREGNDGRDGDMFYPE